MRPISVEFQAFGPYREREIVDFEELSSKGLFLICGETGSGKTMILDAITYALYGKSSGSQREDLQSARCKHSQWGVDTVVDFKFEVNGKIYRFERRLECKRSNLSAKMNAYILNDEGIFEPLFENCKDVDMRKKAQELIGLDYDQFRQVILLPQGQFEKLLTADSSEKEQVLVNIFGVDKWKKIAECLYSKAEERRNSLRKTKELLQNRLADEECSTVDEYVESIECIQKKLEELIKTYELEQYDIRKEKYDKVKNLLLQEEDSLRDVETRKINVKQIEVEIEEAQKNVTNAQVKYDELNKEKANIEQVKVEVTRLEDKRNYYESFEQLLKKLEREEKLLKECGETLKFKNKQVEQAKEEQLQLGNIVKQENEQYAELMAAYVDGIVGGLAKELKEGMPCPVCGSKQHPEKAVFTNRNVSKVDVDLKKEEAEKYEKLFEQKKNLVDKYQKELTECEKACNEQNGKFMLAEQELEHAKGQLLPNVGTIADLEKLIKQNKKLIREYEINLEQALDVLNKGKQNQADYEGKLKNATIEKAKSEDKYKECVENLKKYLDEEEQKLDMEACNKALEEIEYKKKQYTESKTKYEVILDGKKKRVNELISMNNEYENSWNEAEADWNFAKSLRGDTGIGLQRYVLGIMFSSVVSAANRMLEKVHGGRYRLYRTDEKAKGSNKKGLELYVYDSFVGIEEGRSVKTLSGGEKFLVSLALSIGLSTVAKRSGVQLDAMFIDEGFGSLDQNSIEDAMDILMGIQKANGVVGIISHVQLLKDNIPTKLEIVKSKNGSKIINTI